MKLHVSEAVTFAAPVLTGQTAFALTTRVEKLNGRPVAFRRTAGGAIV